MKNLDEVVEENSNSDLQQNLQLHAISFLARFAGFGVWKI